MQVLEEIALLLELKDENFFKVRAFQNAARVLEGNPSDVGSLVETGELEKLKGIGKGKIAQIVHDIYEKGKSKDYEELRKGFPETLFELFKIPGLGAKRIKAVYGKLKIKSVAELESAAQKGRLADLDGFGAKSQDKILAGIRQMKKSAGRFLIDAATNQAEKLLAHLKKQKGIERIEIAGSLRRCKETVKDIDILVSAKNPAAVHQAFIQYPETTSVIAHGETKSSVTLKSGINCDLRTVTLKEFPYALYYFTGSKEHNVAVRTIAKKKGIKINEYGLFKDKRLIPCADEAEIFERVGLHYIPPEVRENTGEIEWAAKKDFPELVEEKDIRGVFHVHSTYSDGVASLEEMVASAEGKGYEYVGISDHSRSAKYAGGLDEKRLYEQWKEIDRLQKHSKIRIFKGIESDILRDGSLDYPEPILSQFDFIIGSVHSQFNLSEPEMTERLARAMENKHTTFLGHLTGRLLLSREGYSLNMERVIDVAKKTGVSIELNAQPQRLELDWHFCQLAKRQGVGVSIHPDAHAVSHMDYVTYGIGIARKGWLEKKDVTNTLGLASMEKFLKKRK